MIERFHRYRGDIIFGLSIAIAVLLLLNIWRWEFVSNTWLRNHKEEFEALGAIFTIVVLFAGSIFSYYRFFRGRTFSLRADLCLEVTIHDSGADFVLHAIRLTAKNVGTSTIWNPIAITDMEIHWKDRTDEVRRISKWWDGPADLVPSNSIHVIETTESTVFYWREPVPKGAYAVSYKAYLESDGGDVWSTAQTVTNTMLDSRTSPALTAAEMALRGP